MRVVVQELLVLFDLSHYCGIWKIRQDNEYSEKLMTDEGIVGFCSMSISKS